MWPPGTTEASVWVSGLYQGLGALEEINKMSFLFLLKRPESAGSLFSLTSTDFPEETRGGGVGWGRHLSWH